MMNRKTLIIIGIIVSAGILVFALLQFSQLLSIPSMPSEQKKVGILITKQRQMMAEGLKKGLAELGYTNVSYIEVPFVIGQTSVEDAKQIFRAFVEGGVDVIYPSSVPRASIALQVTEEMGKDTPIVFVENLLDPLKYGLVNSYRSSGNNITGVFGDITELIRKQLEFLKVINPDAKKVGIFSDGFRVPGVADQMLEELRQQTPRFGLELIEYKTTASPPEATAAWYLIANAIKPGDIDVLFHLPGHYFFYQEAAEDYLAYRLKVLYIGPLEDMPNGGHLAYSADLEAAGKQSARLIGKIFEGEKPSDIPIEVIEKVDLAINLPRAEVIGVKIPESILFLVNIKFGNWAH